MKTLPRALVAIALTAGSFIATAQTMKPGLWEINNKMTTQSGEMEKGMAEMQKQLASMPPEQRKMMEDMIGQSQVFITKRIDIRQFFLSAAAPAVLQHAFYNRVCPFTMVVNFFRIAFYVCCNLFDQIGISFIRFFHQFRGQFLI